MAHDDIVQEQWHEETILGNTKWKRKTANELINKIICEKAYFDYLCTDKWNNGKTIINQDKQL